MAAARARDRYGPEPTAPKPRNDAYVGLLIISLVAMLIGCALLTYDYLSYGDKAPPPVRMEPVKDK
jgi:hypothetical protein